MEESFQISSPHLSLFFKKGEIISARGAMLMRYSRSGQGQKTLV